MASVDVSKKKSRAALIGSFTSDRKKRQDEEARNHSYAEEARKKAEKDKAAAKKKAEPAKNPLDIVGDAIGATGKFLKDIAVDAKDKAVDGFTGTKDVLEGQVVANKTKDVTKQSDKNNKEWSAYMASLKDDDWDKPEVKKKLKEFEANSKNIQSKITDKDRKESKESQAVDAKKTAAGAAETALNVGTLGIGTGVKAVVKQGVKQGVKEITESAAKGGIKKFAKEAAKDAPVGAAYGLTHTAYSDPDADLGDYAKAAAIGGAVGAAAPVAIKGAFKLAKGTDTAAGRAIQRIAERDGEKVSTTLKNIGDNGVVGALNNMISKGGRKAVYAASDAMNKTKVGSKVIDLKDDFMTKWVTENHEIYKVLKRSDFEGKTEGAYLAAREAIGNSNRALSFAQDFIENNDNMASVTAGIEAKSAKLGVSDLVQGRQKFDEYAKVRSELDLAAAGKKQFSEEKMTKLRERASKIGADFAEEYDGLVGFYKDLNDFRLKEGLISQKQYDDLAEEGFDYVRQQRELPQWMLDKPAQKGRGATASITKSDSMQRRNKYASAELLSPTETAIKTAQLAHVEAMRNQAAKRVTALLEEAGEAKVLRTTEIVREKQNLLKELKESKPVAQKIAKTIRSRQNAVARLEREISWLKGDGRRELKQEIRAKGKELNARIAKNPDAPVHAKKMLEELVSMDSKDLRRIRRMIESRDAKLAPLFDSIELMNRDLAEMYAKRKGLWQSAQGLKSSVDKKGKNTMSFLDDGVENIVEVSPEVASAVHVWDKQYQNVLMDVMRFANNVFKYGTTGANADFALPNFVADQVGSAINSRNIWKTHNPSNFVHSFFMTIGKPLNARDSEIMRSFQSANKGQTSINQYTKAATSDKMANKLVRRNAKWNNKTYTVMKNPKEAWRALFDATEGAVALTENITRTQNYRGAFNAAVKEGLEDDASRIANQQARENSVDFLEMGAYGRVVNSLVPYFNAAIQGNRVMMRNAAERPASFAGKITTLIGVPIAATTAWNTMDSDRKAIYDTIPEYIKETNYIVITPGAKWNEDNKKWDGVVMMKKPPGFKEFAEPVRKYMEYVASDDPDKASGLWGFLGEEGGSVAADFGQTFSPIDFSDPNKFLSSITPQILKPTAEAILNKNFFQGEDIVPEYLGDKLPGDQKYERYSQLTSHIAGMFNTSPLKVDHWIKQTFGEVGTNAQHYIDRSMGAPEEAIGGRSLPESISRRFTAPPGGADTDQFYKTYNPASSARKRASAQVTELVKEGRINEARRKAEEYNESISSRFEDFMQAHADSPNYDEKWDERINDLYIPVTEQAFKARKRQQ